MNHSDAINYVGNSLSALNKHRAKTRGAEDNTRVELRHVMDGPNSLHLQIWWTNVPSRAGSEFVWDYLDIEVSGQAEGQQIISQVLNSFPVTLSHEHVSVPRWPNANIPLFHMHPQRYRAVHPLGSVMEREMKHSKVGGFTAELMRFAGESLMRADGQVQNKVSIRQKLKRDMREHFNGAISLASFFADYCHAGKQIFSFPPELSKMFERTDVTDIPLDAIKLPYDSFYLYFGAQKGIEMREGWLADGAYVSILGKGDRKVIQFALTACPEDPTMYSQWAITPEPVYIQAIDAELMKMGIGEAVDTVLSRKIASLQKSITQAPLDTVMEGVEVVDISARNSERELEKLPKLHAAWSHMLRLVVNAMAYLSAYPDDTTPRWSERAPEHLRKHATSGTPLQKKTAESKLAALGYSAVRFCGNSIRSTNSAGSEIDDSKKTATWVRGHWKRQHYGPGRSLRRLLWRMPVLRNADHKPPEGELGHIYLV